MENCLFCCISIIIFVHFSLCWSERNMRQSKIEQNISLFIWCSDVQITNIFMKRNILQILTKRYSIRNFRDFFRLREKIVFISFPTLRHVALCIVLCIQFTWLFDCMQIDGFFFISRFYSTGIKMCCLLPNLFFSIWLSKHASDWITCLVM